MAIAEDEFSENAASCGQVYVARPVGADGWNKTQDVTAGMDAEIATVSGPDAAEADGIDVITGAQPRSGELIPVRVAPGVHVAISGFDVNVATTDPAQE